MGRVSIPQSGFGAFEPSAGACQRRPPQRAFQSLSRDSGRLNQMFIFSSASAIKVSIPQSGFGAFEQAARRLGETAYNYVSIPQSGFGAFELRTAALEDPEVLRVSIPQSGFGAFEHPPVGRPRGPGSSFNPSVGIRGV